MRVLRRLQPPMFAKRLFTVRTTRTAVLTRFASAAPTPIRPGVLVFDLDGTLVGQSSAAPARRSLQLTVSPRRWKRRQTCAPQ